MEIERGLPPEPQPGRPIQYPFEELKKPEDFFAWTLAWNEKAAPRRSAILRCAKHRGYKVTTRTMWQGKKKKIFVWRVFD